jgi:plastocyanin
MTGFPRQLPLYAAAVGALLLVPAVTPAAAASPVVVIDHMKYGAVPMLRRGDTIVFFNKDMFRHTVTAADNRFSLDLPPGARARLHVASAGTIAFYCKYHPGMRGEIVAR